MLALLAFVTAARAELALVAEVNGRFVRFDRMGINQLVGRADAEIVRVPFQAAHVDGDLRANPRCLYWPGFFFLHRPPTRDGLPDSERPWFAYLRVVEGEYWNGAKADAIWAEPIPDGAVVVFGWMVDGRIVQQSAIPLPDRAHRHRYRVDHCFQLAAEQNMGQPVILLWADGRFISVRSMFKDPVAQRIDDAMMLGDFQTFHAGLTAEFVRKPVAGELLFRAARAGVLQAVDALLRLGVPPDSADSPTAMVVAADKGRLPIVERLLAAKASPQRHDNESSVLQIALRGGHADIAERLLDAGADIKGRGPYHPSPLDQAIEGGHADLARKLLQKGARRKWPGPPAELMQLVALGRVSSVQLLLEHNSDPNAVVRPSTPLIVAARMRNLAMVDALLAGGAKADLADVSGLTPLMVASMNGDVPMARKLIAAGATQLAQRNNGNRVLHYGVMPEGKDVAELLIAQGADVNAIGASGLRPLEIALLAGRQATTKVLLTHGATVDFTGKLAPRFVEAAVLLDLSELINLALGKGWRPDSQLPGGGTLGDLARLAEAGAVEKRLQAAGGGANIGASVTFALPAELDAPLRAVQTESPRDTRARSEGPGAVRAEFEVFIDATGAVLGVRPTACADGALALSGVETLRRWRFATPTKQGVPVATRAVQVLEFPALVGELVDRAFVDIPPIPFTRWIPSGHGGEVRLVCVVGTDGHASQVTTFDHKDEYLAPAAAEAAPDWAFTPAILRGARVPVRVEVTVPFR